MKKTLFVLSVLSTAVLTGCGGGGGGSDSSTPKIASKSKYDSSFDIHNGIYFNSADSVVMVVDSHRAKNNVAMAEFGSSITDTSNSSALMVEHSEAAADTMKIFGLQFEVKNGTSLVGERDLTATATASFSGNTVSLTGKVHTTPLVYSMDKVAASLPISSLVGTHNSVDGTEWKVNSDGSFIVNGICTLTGTLSRTGDYYDVSADATSCKVADMNGKHSGVFFTVNQNSKDYIVGIIGNEEGLIWGSALKN